MFEEQARTLKMDLDDMVFTFEYVGSNPNDVIDPITTAAAQKVQIKIWETYKIHPSMEKINILEYGGWDSTITELDLPSIYY